MAYCLLWSFEKQRLWSLGGFHSPPWWLPTWDPQYIPPSFCLMDDVQFLYSVCYPWWCVGAVIFCFLSICPYVRLPRTFAFMHSVMKCFLKIWAIIGKRSQAGSFTGGREMTWPSLAILSFPKPTHHKQSSSSNRIHRVPPWAVGSQEKFGRG